jgi:predicted RND superfamily exporter protein
MWARVAGIVLRNRITILVIIGLITAFMAYQAIIGVRLSYSYMKVLPEKDTAYVEHMRFKEIFGEEANIMAVGVQDDNFFDYKKYKKWMKLERDLRKQDGVTNVVSIYDIINLKRNKAEKKFDIEKVFKEKEIKSQKDLDTLKNIAKSLPFYRDIFYNDTSNIYLMTISLSKHKLDTVARMQLIEDIVQITEKYGEDNNVELHYSGLPYIRTEITKKVKTEMNLFIILAFVVCIIILYLFFRSIKVVFFSILVVSVGVIWSFGTLALFNYEVTMLIGMIPPLLIVIGIPNSIFLLNKYHAEYKGHGNKIKALQRAINKIGNAIFLTNLTTASGFATFILTSSDILKEFGVIASINIIAMFFLALTMIPIIFSFLNPPKDRHTKHLDNKIVSKIIEMLVRFTLNYRKAIYYITIGIFILSVVGILLMKSTGYMVDDIPHDDRVYVDLKFFEKNFNGVLPYEIVIDTKKPKGVIGSSSGNIFSKKEDTTTLQRIDLLQNYLSTLTVETEKGTVNAFSKSLSIVDAIKFANQAYIHGKEDAYELPSDMAFIMPYLSLKKENDDKINTEALKILNSYLDKKKQITHISLRTADVGTVELSRLTDEIKAKADEIFPPDKYDVVCTGISVVFFKGTKYLIRNLFLSLFLAVVLISFFMSGMFKSFRMVIISLIPNLIPLIMTAALMGYFGIPIKPSTILVFSIAFGISVDDTIHYLAKYRQELIATNWDIGKSAVIAIRETGISMMYTSIVLFFGFGMFVASEFGGTMALGLLVSFTLLVAMLANLVLLPALLLSLENSITRKAFNKEPLIQIFDEEEDIELDDLEIEEDKSLQ